MSRIFKKKHAMADFKVNPIVNGICEYNLESTEKHACIDASRVNNIIVYLFDLYKRSLDIAGFLSMLIEHLILEYSTNLNKNFRSLFSLILTFGNVPYALVGRVVDEAI